MIRVGPDCRVYGDPFEYAVAFKIVPGETFRRTAVIKALVVAHGDFTAAHARAVIRILAAADIASTWDRIKLN